MVEQDIADSQQIGGIFNGVYLADGTLIGVVDFVPQGWAGDPQCAYLSLLMIAQPYRGQGIGAAVVQLIEGKIRENPGITTIHAGVQVNNPGAIRFWERHGYHIVSGPELHPDQTTAFRLRKDLPS
jgi:RimJ/RimL family protein N-acetyltransferase